MAIKKIDGQKVHCMAKVKASKADKTGIDVAWTFDFTGCPDIGKLTLAARSLVIDVQGDWRAAKPGDRKSLINKTFLVRDYISKKGKRKPKRPPTVKEVKDTLAQMNPQELALVFEQYNKNQEK